MSYVILNQYNTINVIILFKVVNTFGLKPAGKHSMSCHVISYHIISYHIISYHIISYHIISCHIMSCHIISYHIISYHIISYHISYHIMSCYVMSCLWRSKTSPPPPLTHTFKSPSNSPNHQQNQGLICSLKRKRQQSKSQ